jgi:hypothetical protein
MNDQEVNRYMDMDSQPKHDFESSKPVSHINKATIWEKSKHFLTVFPKWFGLYLGLAGLITFNLFILEEAFQTCMFGGWPAADAQEWRLVKRNIETMEKLRTTLIVVNNIGGWIHPFAWIAYDAYGKSEREYIDGLTAKCFANCPECFNGEKVTFTFKPQEEYPEDGYWKLINGATTVFIRQRTPVITGIVKILEDGTTLVDAR